MTYIMFEKPKKKSLNKEGNKLLINFDKIEISKPIRKDIIIEKDKTKEVVKLPKIKHKPLKKGKKLF